MLLAELRKRGCRIAKNGGFGNNGNFGQNRNNGGFGRGNGQGNNQSQFGNNGRGRGQGQFGRGRSDQFNMAQDDEVDDEQMNDDDLFLCYLSEFQEVTGYEVELPEELNN